VIFLALLAWLLVILGASVGTQALWGAAANSRVIAFVLAPGVIVHEMSHILACLVTGATVKEASLVDSGRGGRVTHTKPAVPVLGQALISLAPMVGCGACLWLATAGFLGPASAQFVPRHELPKELLQPGVCAKYLVDVLTEMWAAVAGADYRDWRTYLFIYVAITLVIHLSPSRRDWASGMLAIILVCCGVFAVGQVWPDQVTRPIQTVWPFLTLCLALSLSVCALSLAAIGSVRLIRALIRAGQGK